MPIISVRRPYTEVQVNWFRNLFKSHTQKRIEARHREEEAWRSSHRAAGPELPITPESETPATDDSKPHARLDKAS